MQNPGKQYERIPSELLLQQRLQLWEEQFGQQKVPDMVGAKLAFKAINCECEGVGHDSGIVQQNVPLSEIANTHTHTTNILILVALGNQPNKHITNLNI